MLKDTDSNDKYFLDDTCNHRGEMLESTAEIKLQ